MSSPLVTVVIPCYNAGRWILETLESVRNQTWKNIEIIIVNDGSTDNSVALIEAFELPSLSLIHQENKGQTAALNAGLAAATGDYVQYLDADDLLHPEKIEIQMKRLIENPGCMASAEWVRFFDKTEGLVFSPDDTWQDLAPVDWLVLAWKEGGGMLYPAMWLLPTALAKNIGGWAEELNLNNDADYFVRAILASEKILFCPGAKTYYRSGVAGSLSGLKSEKGWRSQWKVLENCESYLLEKENSDRTRRVISMLWQRFVFAAYLYQPQLSHMASQRAKALHPEKLGVEGGVYFKLLSNIAGWKFAMKLQKLVGSR